MVFEIRHLRIVDAIARSGSVTGAEQVLHISQPAISRSLKKLELNLGVRLFERLPTGMVPTPACQRLLETSDKVLLELDQAEEALARCRDDRLGSVAQRFLHETYLSFDQNTLYCRHNTIREHRPSILLIHGLGESGLSFVEIFDDDRFDAFNVVVPDLLGYGRSSRSATRDYAFEIHLDYLRRIVAAFDLEHLTVVGHSLGGDLGTLLCQQDSLGRIKRFVNVEGNLTEADLFISAEAARAGAVGKFDDWFRREFLDRQVYGKWCPRWRFGHRYLASLHFCDPEAFLQNATELWRHNRDRGPRASGTLYHALSLSKLFVFGQESLAPASRQFLQDHGLEAYGIGGSYHWPMIESPSKFYDALHRWCQGDTISAAST